VSIPAREFGREVFQLASAVEYHDESYAKTQAKRRERAKLRTGVFTREES
jgi:hypothetical protein